MLKHIRYLYVAAALAVGVAHPQPVQAAGTSYCVDADHGSDSNDGISTYTQDPVTHIWSCPVTGGHGPWLTIGRHNGTAQLNAISGLHAVGPCDTESVVASTVVYDNAFFSGIGVAGHPECPTTFQGVPGVRGARPFISSTTSRAGTVNFSATDLYVVFQDFDVSNSTSVNPNGGGILIGGSGSPNTVAYITINRVSVFGTGAFGIGATYADHITVENSLVYNNGSTITNASDSGISLYSLCNYDNAAGYHNYVLNNIVYGQNAGASSNPGKTDGQGLIDDDAFGDQSAACGHVPYAGSTLWQGNVAFNNEGGGIKIYNNGTAHHVDIFNNTFWENCQGALNLPCHTNDGDIQVLGFGGIFASNVNIQGNTTVGRYRGISAKGLTASGPPVAATLNNNDGATGATFWDNSGTFTSTCSLATDPLLQNPQASPVGADFRPTASSPAPSC